MNLNSNPPSVPQFLSCKPVRPIKLQECCCKKIESKIVKINNDEPRTVDLSTSDLRAIGDLIHRAYAGDWPLLDVNIPLNVLMDKLGFEIVDYNPYTH